MNYKIYTLMIVSLTSHIYAIDTSNNNISTDGIGETYISGQTFNNKKVYYGIKDDLAIFEGDILLGTVDESEAWRESEEALDDNTTMDNITANAQIIKGARYRWPNAVIPYTISSNVSAQTRTLISRAITHISSRTHVRFVAKTSTHSNYVNISSTQDACYSNVGNLQRGQQTINVVAACGQSGIIHELTHAIGLWHEQSRIDRNSYIRINWANIQSGQQHNFNQHISDGVDIGPYDYSSLMHYSSHAFSANGKATITPLRSNVSIGQRNGLSQGDINAINSMYPRGGGGSSSTSWSTGAYANKHDTSKTLSIVGASALTIRVSGVTEANYDFIYIYNASGQVVKKLHGNINTTFTVSGSSIRARLTSDHSITKSGVTVSISKSSGGGGEGSSSNIHYEFNSNNNAQGWSYKNLSQHGSGPTGGAWYFQAKYNDPQLISPSLNINAGVIKKVVIQMANDHNPAYYGRMQVFWRKSGEGYSEGNSKIISVTNHGGWTTYTIDMTGNPRWNGTIREIRIDPILRGDGHWLAFNYIRFTR